MLAREYNARRTRTQSAASWLLPSCPSPHYYSFGFGANRHLRQGTILGGTRYRDLGWASSTLRFSMSQTYTGECLGSNIHHGRLRRNKTPHPLASTPLTDGSSAWMSGWTVRIPFFFQSGARRFHRCRHEIRGQISGKGGRGRLDAGARLDNPIIKNTGAHPLTVSPVLLFTVIFSP